LLKGLCALLQWALKGNITSQCWYGTFYKWFQEDLKLWQAERKVDHHIGAFGGMGSFNDLAGPDPDFPGGEEGFEYFYNAYLLLKNLSYLSAQLWYWFLHDYPEHIDSKLKIIFNGIPVTICTCIKGHSWMKEDINISFYTSHANQISEMRQCLRLIQDKGGERAVKWLLKNKIKADPESIRSEMKEALARAGIINRPEKCQACKGKDIPSVLQYLLGDPLELSTDHFRTEEL